MTTASLSSETSPLLRSPTSSSTLTDAHERANSAPDRPPISRLRATAIIASIGFLIFILTLNISLLTTIQSPIATDLDAFSSVTWFTSTYLIATTSITPVAGRLSQIFSAKVYLFASIILQACGLIITAVAPRLAVFLLGRAITGIGSGAITPVAFILVTKLTSSRRRGLFFGMLNTGYTTGIALGAILAGALEPIIGWRAVFGLQVPFTLTAATIALFAIPDTSDPAIKSQSEVPLSLKLARIDFLGVFTLISAVVLLLYGLSAPKVDSIPIFLSGAMFLLFIFVEATWAHEPIVPISVLTSWGTIMTGLATIGVMAARWGILFYSPVYAIAVRGWPQASAGLMLLPTNSGFALGGVLAGWLHIRRAGSFYAASLITCLLFAMSLFAVSLLCKQDSNVWVFISGVFVNGFITGAFLNYSLAHVLHLTIPLTHVIVIPVNAMFRGLSGSFGSSIGGGIFQRTLRRTLESDFAQRNVTGKEQLILKLLGTPTLIKSLSGVEKEVAIDGYVTALSSLFLGGSILALGMAFIQAGTGWTAPENTDDEDILSNRDPISPVLSREPIAS